jgi:hypothetical protein
MRLFFISLCLFLVFLFPVFAQDAPAPVNGTPPGPPPEIPAGSGSALSRNFFGLALGDNLAAVKDRLKGHPYFFFRGEPDVSFLPLKTQTVIDCQGVYYVKRGLFQFSGENLYIITLYFNPERMDYYSLFTALSEKYGRPGSLDPSAAVWQNGETRLALEKPLTLKYIDQETFGKLKAEGETQKSIEEESRRKFLDSF